MKGMSIGTTKTIRKILQNLLHEKKNWHAGNSSIFVVGGGGGAAGGGGGGGGGGVGGGEW